MFSLRDLPDELKAAGTLLTLDAVWHRVADPADRRPRLVTVDEAWLVMRDSEGARFLFRMAKSARKHWCGLTVVTQDAADLLGKIVASRRALQLAWRNSEQLQGDLMEEVTRLKADPTIGRIALSGSVSIVRQLLAAGLLDELHLFVHPVLAGKGLRLFEDDSSQIPLRLLTSQRFGTGVVYLVYGPDPDPPAGGYEQAKENLLDDHGPRT